MPRTKTKKPILKKAVKKVSAKKSPKSPILISQGLVTPGQKSKALITSLTLVSHSHEINTQPTKVVRGIKINKKGTKVKVYYQKQM